VTIDDFMEIGRIKSKSARYAAKRNAAIQTAANALMTHKAPYLALSGGKDSVAMAFLVNEAALLCNRDFRVWCHVSDASFPGTVETVRAVCAAINRPLDIHESQTSAFELIANPQKQAFGKTGHYFDSVRAYANDKDLAFVGVRAFESKRRMRAAKIKGTTFTSESMGGVTICQPLLWFRLEDVAATLYEFDAPIHPIYSKMALDTRNRFGEEQWIRLGYITSRDLLNKGTAVFLKTNYPDQFAKLAAAYPEVRNFI
jgi:3'-phosphoadenosine 5'-phosphosulfate sulfotransferase (PAPS reductase)/FAD synthetase